MFLYTLITPLLITILIGGFFLLKSNNQGRVFIWEYLLLIIPIIVWNLLASSGFGSQSLSNVVEVFILSIIIIGYTLYRLKKPFAKMEIKMALTIILIVMPFVLRATFPHLSE